MKKLISIKVTEELDGRLKALPWGAMTPLVAGASDMLLSIAEEVAVSGAKMDNLYRRWLFELAERISGMFGSGSLRALIIWPDRVRAVAVAANVPADGVMLGRGAILAQLLAVSPKAYAHVTAPMREVGL